MVCNLPPLILWMYAPSLSLMWPYTLARTAYTTCLNNSSQIRKQWPKSNFQHRWISSQYNSKEEYLSLLQLCQPLEEFIRWRYVYFQAVQCNWSQPLHFKWKYWLHKITLFPDNAHIMTQVCASQSFLRSQWQVCSRSPSLNRLKLTIKRSTSTSVMI